MSRELLTKISLGEDTRRAGLRDPDTWPYLSFRADLGLARLAATHPRARHTL